MVNRITVATVIAEIGVDTGPFVNAVHLASWSA
jgi:hypothetical protein